MRTPFDFRPSRLAPAARLLLAGLVAVSCLVAQPALAADVAPRVRIETSLGSFVVELNTDRAPLTSANFLDYVKTNHYDGTIFHRVINNFVIQGGGFDTSYKLKPTRAPVPAPAAPQAPDIKKRLESLLDRDYLERDEADATMYTYLA